jgi:hypothetical protein
MAIIVQERGDVMKREVTKRVAQLGLLLVMAIVAAGTQAKAQSLEYRLTANIPFDFTVADKKLPSGKYSIGRAQSNTGDLVLQINNVAGGGSLTRLTIPVNTVHPKEKGTLVFHRYGDQYFLYQVWPAGGSIGRALPKSRSERDVERKAQDTFGAAAMNTNHMEIVTIVVDRS